MEVLFVVSTERGGLIAKSMAAACIRQGVTWGGFFTNDGVKALADENFCDLLHETAGEAMACAQAWTVHMNGLPCPVEVGSQFDHAGMLSRSAKVVSL